MIMSESQSSSINLWFPHPSGSWMHGDSRLSKAKRAQHGVSFLWKFGQRWNNTLMRCDITSGYFLCSHKKSWKWNILPSHPRSDTLACLNHQVVHHSNGRHGDHMSSVRRLWHGTHVSLCLIHTKAAQSRRTSEGRSSASASHGCLTGLSECTESLRGLWVSWYLYMLGHTACPFSSFNLYGLANTCVIMLL